MVKGAEHEHSCQNRADQDTRADAEPKSTLGLTENKPTQVATRSNEKGHDQAK